MSATAIPSTDRWRDLLVSLGFTDNGHRLRGAVPWTSPQVGHATARVEITVDSAFPFGPPRVRVLDPGAPLDQTFHIERDGALCLWDDEWSVDQAPWRDPDAFVARIAGWLEATAAGWPGDASCDLERYLPYDSDSFILYDESALILNTPVRTCLGAGPGTRVVTDKRRNVRQRRGDPRRRDRGLAWVADVGEIHRPMWSWTDVAAALGDHASDVAKLINLGSLAWLLLRYRHGGASGLLALHVSRTTSGIRTAACESADRSEKTRALRAGSSATDLAATRVAVIGCGAIGSFTADLLFRSGVRQLTLCDGQRMRPGNVVRHLAGLDQVGQHKTAAVRAVLAAIDPDVSRVAVRGPVLDLDDATDLARNHHVVLDATGSARATSLLSVAANQVGRGTGHTVVSVCAQRAGGVVRVDRMPLRSGEAHLPALPMTDEDELLELGCGSPVSRTPPAAVVAAAELARRVVVDELLQECALPATVAEARIHQEEPPFDRLGTITSTDVVDVSRTTVS